MVKDYQIAGLTNHLNGGILLYIYRQDGRISGVRSNEVSLYIISITVCASTLTY